MPQDPRLSASLAREPLAAQQKHFGELKFARADKVEGPGIRRSTRYNGVNNIGVERCSVSLSFSAKFATEMRALRCRNTGTWWEIRSAEQFTHSLRKSNVTQ